MSSRRQRSIILGGRYRQVSLYISLCTLRTRNKDLLSLLLLKNVIYNHILLNSVCNCQLYTAYIACACIIVVVITIIVIIIIITTCITIIIILIILHLLLLFLLRIHIIIVAVPISLEIKKHLVFFFTEIICTNKLEVRCQRFSLSPSFWTK